MRACLLGLLGLACSTASLRTQLPGGLLTRGTTHVVSDDEAAAVGRDLEDKLEQVKRVLAPICDDRCGMVGLAVDSTERAYNSPSRFDKASMIYYSPQHIVGLGPDPTFRFWAMAHEYGHHLDRVSDFSRIALPSDAPLCWARWDAETKADAIAGCALRLAMHSAERVADWLVEGKSNLDPLVNAYLEMNGADESHPHPEFSGRALLAGSALCSKRVPLLSELLQLGEEVADAAIARSRERYQEQAASEEK